MQKCQDLQAHQLPEEFKCLVDIMMSIALLPKAQNITFGKIKREFILMTNCRCCQDILWFAVMLLFILASLTVLPSSAHTKHIDLLAAIR